MDERVTQHSMPPRPTHLAVLFDDEFYHWKDKLRSAVFGYYGVLAMILLIAVVLFYAGQGLRQASYDRGFAEGQLSVLQEGIR